MTEEFKSTGDALSISAVEREVGLPKDTLRAWERRYGFPRPQRDAQGQRAYPRDQVEQLRRLWRLVKAGQRPGRLMGLSAVELEARAQALGRGAPGMPVADAQVEEALQLLRLRGSEGLAPWLQQRLALLGIRAFVLSVVAPLTRGVGQAWQRGELQVFQEHLFTETVQGVLRAALQPFQAAGLRQRPRVLLTTVPGEEHALGLLMVEALLTVEGASCLSLGTQTPLAEIVAAVRAHAIDIVGLSFAGSLPASRVDGALGELTTRLPAAVDIWAGGSAMAVPRAVRGMDLASIAPAVAAWREKTCHLTVRPTE